MLKRFCCLLLLMTSCVGAQITEREKISYIVGNASCKTAQQMQLKTFGFGIVGCEDIEGFSLDYIAYQDADIMIARKLIVNFADEFLKNVKSEFSFDDPRFNLDLFSIQIGFFDKNNDWIEDPNKISKVDLFKSKVLYKHHDQHEFITVYSETFEEAKQKLADRVQ